MWPLNNRNRTEIIFLGSRFFLKTVKINAKSGLSIPILGRLKGPERILVDQGRVRLEYCHSQNLFWDLGETPILCQNRNERRVVPEMLCISERSAELAISASKIG